MPRLLSLQVADAASYPSSMAGEVLPSSSIGHTLGHCGVAVQRAGRWLLQAGDAYFFHQEMDPERPWCTPGLRAYQTLLEKDRKARLANQVRLRELCRDHAGEVDVCCGHDVDEFERLSGRSVEVPVSQLVRPERPRTKPEDSRPQL
jgi:glyoxylase-like metal-dependent hydrolase (beta-lactamase superfamily II)